MAKEVLCFHIVDFAASDVLHGGFQANPRPQVSGENWIPGNTGKSCSAKVIIA